MEVSETHARGLRKNLFAEVIESEADAMKLIGYMQYAKMKFSNPKTQAAYTKKLLDHVYATAWYVDDKIEHHNMFMGVIPCNSKVFTQASDVKYSEDTLSFYVLTVNIKQSINEIHFNGPIHLSAHAIERVFTRMKSNNLNAVKRMIGHSLFWAHIILISLHPYGSSRRPRRIGVPVYGGVFIIEIDNNSDVYLVKTFIIPESGSWLDKSCMVTREVLGNITWSNYTKITQKLFALPENKWWFEYENRELSRCD